VHSCLGHDEIVPSSNPNSESSIDDEVLLSVAQQYDASIGEENICQQPLFQSPEKGG